MVLVSAAPVDCNPLGTHCIGFFELIGTWLEQDLVGFGSGA